MRYTMIVLGTFQLLVIGALTDEDIQRCRDGQVAIVDMELQRELSPNGTWVDLREVH